MRIISSCDFHCFKNILFTYIDHSLNNINVIMPYQANPYLGTNV